MLGMFLSALLAAGTAWSYEVPADTGWTSFAPGCMGVDTDADSVVDARECSFGAFFGGFASETHALPPGPLLPGDSLTYSVDMTPIGGDTPNAGIGQGPLSDFDLRFCWLAVEEDLSTSGPSTPGERYRAEGLVGTAILSPGLVVDSHNTPDRFFGKWGEPVRITLTLTNLGGGRDAFTCQFVTSIDDTTTSTIPDTQTDANCRRRPGPRSTVWTSCSTGPSRTSGSAGCRPSPGGRISRP